MHGIAPADTTHTAVGGSSGHSTVEVASLSQNVQSIAKNIFEGFCSRDRTCMNYPQRVARSDPSHPLHSVSVCGDGSISLGSKACVCESRLSVCVPPHDCCATTTTHLSITCVAWKARTAPDENRLFTFHICVVVVP